MSYPKTEVEQPPRHLRGYEKPYLKAGESKIVEFALVRIPYDDQKLIV
jgi:beta-glucosidase